MLNCRTDYRIGLPGVANHAVGGQAHAPRRRDHAAAPITEHIAIGGDIDRRRRGQEIRLDEDWRTREVCAQYHDHGRRLWKVVEHFESDAKFHSNAFWL